MYSLHVGTTKRLEDNTKSISIALSGIDRYIGYKVVDQ